MLACRHVIHKDPLTIFYIASWEKKGERMMAGRSNERRLQGQLDVLVLEGEAIILDRFKRTRN